MNDRSSTTTEGSNDSLLSTTRDEHPTMNQFDEILIALNGLLGEEEKRALIVVVRSLNGFIRFDSTIFDLEATIRNCLSANNANQSFTFLYHVVKELLQALGKTGIVVEGLEDIFERIRSDLRPYQLGESHPNIDYRLVVVEFLYKLKHDDYTLLTNLISSKLLINSDQFARRCDLADELFCRQFLPSTLSTSDDITPIYKISISFNHDHLFERLCHRQGLSKPEIDRNLIITRQRSELLEEVFAFINNNVAGRKQHRSYPSLKQICISLCLLCFIISLIVGILVVGYVVSEHFTHSPVSDNGSLNIKARSVVNIRNDGFRANLGTIDLSLLSNLSNAPVDVYKTDCSEITYSTTNLSSDPYPPSCLRFFNRQQFNRDDKPFSGIQGSYISFHVSAVLTNPRVNSSCMSRVRIFDNYKYFHEAMRNDGDREVEGSYNISRCLSPNDTWTYTFNTSHQSIYASLDVDAYVKVTRYVTGKLLNYNIQSLTALSNCFHPVKVHEESPIPRHCSIDICGDLCISSGHQNSTCILVDNRSNTEIRLLFDIYGPKYSVPFFVAVAVTGVILIITLVVYVIVCCCCIRRWQYCKSQRDIVYQVVPNDDDDKSKTV